MVEHADRDAVPDDRRPDDPLCGSEDRDDNALLLSPWPESLLAFEQIWARLAEHTHPAAIDSPGFGHSERRDTLLSPRAMGEFVVRAADLFGLEHPHAVGPDIGTGALLFAAALYPGRLCSLVVGSGGAAFPLQLGGLVKEWVEAPDLDGYRTPTRSGSSPVRSTGIDVNHASRFRPRGRPFRLRRRPFVESMRYVRSDPTESSGLRDLAGDRDARADHRRRARPGGAAGERRISPRATTKEQARHRRRWPLHVGGRGRRVRRARQGLGGAAATRARGLARAPIQVQRTL